MSDVEAWLMVKAMLAAIATDIVERSGEEPEPSREGNIDHIALMIGSSEEYAEQVFDAIIREAEAIDGQGGVPAIEWAAYICLRLGERIGYGKAARQFGPTLE